MHLISLIIIWFSVSYLSVTAENGNPTINNKHNKADQIPIIVQGTIVDSLTNEPVMGRVFINSTTDGIAYADTADTDSEGFYMATGSVTGIHEVTGPTPMQYRLQSFGGELELGIVKPQNITVIKYNSAGQEVKRIKYNASAGNLRISFDDNDANGLYPTKIIGEDFYAEAKYLNIDGYKNFSTGTMLVKQKGNIPRPPLNKTAGVIFDANFEVFSTGYKTKTTNHKLNTDAPNIVNLTIAKNNYRPRFKDLADLTQFQSDTSYINLLNKVWDDKDIHDLNFSTTSDNGYAQLNIDDGLLRLICESIGVDSIRVYATDKEGATGSTAFALRINEVPNDPPQASPVADKNMLQGDTIYVSLNDVFDDDHTPDNLLIYNATSRDGDVALNIDQGILRLIANNSGDDRVTLYATDEGGKKGSTAFDVDIARIYQLSFNDIKNISTGELVEGDTIKVINSSTLEKIAQGITNASGDAQLGVPEGRYYFIFNKNGYYPRETQDHDVNDDQTLTEVRLDTTNFPMLLLNEIARGERTTDPAQATGDVNRWVTPPLEVVYNTNDSLVAGGIDEAGYDVIKDLWDNEIKPATQTHLYPEGFFKDVDVVKRNIPYLDWRGDNYFVPGKIVIQYEDGLSSAALMQTHVNSNGEVDGAMITLQGTLSPSETFYFNRMVLHELAKTPFRVDRNTQTDISTYNTSPSDQVESLTTNDNTLLRSVYSRPTKWKANDKSR